MEKFVENAIALVNRGGLSLVVSPVMGLLRVTTVKEKLEIRHGDVQNVLHDRYSRAAGPNLQGAGCPGIVGPLKHKFGRGRAAPRSRSERKHGSQP